MSIPLLAKCMTKFTITMKNDGGNIFSNLHNVTVMSFSSISRAGTISVLEQISRKKQDNLIKGLITREGNDLRKTIGRSCCDVVIMALQTKNLALFEMDTM